MCVHAHAHVFSLLNVLDVSMCQDLCLIHSFHGWPAGLPFNRLPFCPCDGGTRGLTGEFVSRSFWGAISQKHGLAFIMPCCPRGDGKLFLCPNLGLLSFPGVGKKLTRHWSLQNVSPDSAKTLRMWNSYWAERRVRGLLNPTFYFSVLAVIPKAGQSCPLGTIWKCVAGGLEGVGCHGDGRALPAF